jgi:hypothetical protein
VSWLKPAWCWVPGFTYTGAPPPVPLELLDEPVLDVDVLVEEAVDEELLPLLDVVLELLLPTEFLWHIFVSVSQ